VRLVGHPLGELSPYGFLHLPGQLRQHVVEQRELGRRSAVRGDEEEVGHLAQKLTPPRARGLARQSDQVMQFGLSGHG
jgi:hypothetical protein